MADDPRRYGFNYLHLRGNTDMKLETTKHYTSTFILPTPKIQILRGKLIIHRTI